MKLHVSPRKSERDDEETVLTVRTPRFSHPRAVVMMYALNAVSDRHALRVRCAETTKNRT